MDDDNRRGRAILRRLVNFYFWMSSLDFERDAALLDGDDATRHVHDVSIVG
jgi:hypothetical protein